MSQNQNPPKKKNRTKYSMRLETGLLDEARELNIDVKLLIENTLGEAISSIKLSLNQVPKKTG